MLGGEHEKLEAAGDNAPIPAAVTDTGCERELNEDRYAVIDSPVGTAWIVCDGMGGVTGGELAAQIAIEAMRRDLLNVTASDAESALESAISESNRVIVLRRQNQAFAEMGTTVVGALFSGPEIVIGNVGDSRAYIIHGNAAKQITKDHTYVQGLVDKGEIQPEDALSHQQAHVLTRAIGAEPSVQVDITRLFIWPSSEDSAVTNDMLLLCTDGLYSLVSDSELASIVYNSSPQRACAQLVELAKSRGGFDNITLAIIPLPGHANEAPPPGYDAGAERRRRQQRFNPIKLSESPQLGKLLVQIGLLSGMAALFVVLVMIIALSR